MKSYKSKFLPPEWHPQSGVMVTWPHEKSDWIDLLDEVIHCFVLISKEILKEEKLLVICSDPVAVANKFDESELKNLILVQLQSNDTWARDHGPITVFVDGRPELFDFQFNGWGMKFAACLDNQLTKQIFEKKLFSGDIIYRNYLDFVFEGGSFETDGLGTLLTTESCLLSINRNQKMSKEEIELYLIQVFNLQRVIWLKNGYLAGDDTDSHVDTLVRFCSEKVIAYVKCDDPSDEHYFQLNEMEKEIKSFRTLDGEPYELIALPMAERMLDDNGDRIPATYANFLIINNKVLIPFYSTSKDEIARASLQKAFPEREVVGIECSILIQQHGSLHCVTMQLPVGVM